MKILEKFDPFAEQLDAPEAVLSVPDERQPRRPCASRFRPIVLGQYSAEHVLVNLDAEGPGDDERVVRAADQPFGDMIS